MYIIGKIKCSIKDYIHSQLFRSIKEITGDWLLKYNLKADKMITIIIDPELAKNVDKNKLEENILPYFETIYSIEVY
jgi:hypothetical protein